MGPINSFKGAFGFLSNFHQHQLEFEGISFPTSEHAFQAAKSLDPADRRHIAGLTTPGKAKAAGKRVKLRANWNDIRVAIMTAILRIKFSDPGLKEALLATGDAPLIEGNTWNDTFWGVCRGKGQNNLGKILEAIRIELRAAP